MPDTAQKTDKLTITEALTLVMQDVQAISKRDRNDAQKFMFRGIDAVMNAVGPALREHGVVILPVHVETAYRDVQTTGGKASKECTVIVTYRAYGPAGDFIEGQEPGEAMDWGDKGTAKATSVAYRQFLLHLFTIPTDEKDPDEYTYERAAAQAAPRIRTTAQAAVAGWKNRALQAAHQIQPNMDNSELGAYVVAACEARGLNKDSADDLQKLVNEWETGEISGPNFASSEPASGDDLWADGEQAGQAFNDSPEVEGSYAKLLVGGYGVRVPKGTGQAGLVVKVVKKDGTAHRETLDALMDERAGWEIWSSLKGQQP